MKTILYIDGFNLFYSAVKGTPLRWLNPVALMERAFPRNQIIGTKYFTAKVTALPNNPGHDRRHWRVPQAADLGMTASTLPADLRNAWEALREILAKVPDVPALPGDEFQ